MDTHKLTPHKFMYHQSALCQHRRESLEEMQLCVHVIAARPVFLCEFLALQIHSYNGSLYKKSYTVNDTVKLCIIDYVITEL